jgi:Type IV secretion system pilin
MKRKLCILLMFIGLLTPVLATPASVGAVNVFQACTGNNGSNNGANAGSSDVCAAKNSSSNPVIKALKVALEILSIIVGIAAVAMIIIGGIKLSMSSGDASAVKSGRDTVIYALIGVIVAISAQAIVAFVLDKVK